MSGYLKAAIAILSSYGGLCVMVTRLVEHLTGVQVPTEVALLLGAIVGIGVLGPVIYLVGEDIDERDFERELQR
jgi:hypothetical protein